MKETPSDAKNRELLGVFLQEYYALEKQAVLLPDMQEEIPAADILDYLTKDEEEGRLIWYYALVHQYAYWSRYQKLDHSDLSFLTLTDILEYPMDYLDKQKAHSQDIPTISR